MDILQPPMVQYQYIIPKAPCQVDKGFKKGEFYDF